MRENILKFDDYYLLSVQGKSQEWMMDIAYRYLPPENLPKGILTIGESGETNKHTEKLLAEILKTKSNHFILFDDASYSGQQFSDYLSQFSSQLRWYNAKENPPKEGEFKFLETKNIYFIYGAAPRNKDWKSIIEKFNFEQHNVNIHFVTSHFLENMEGLMNKENLPEHERAEIFRIAGGTHKSLLTTEWKTPDFISIPDYVTTGFIANDFKSNLTGLNCNADGFFPGISVAKFDGIPPITPIIPPYKRKTRMN